MKTTITVGQSVQVVNIGQPEYWNKITISKEFDGDTHEQYEIDTLFEKVEEAHEKHSQSMVETNFAPPIKKETFADLKRELHVSPK